jgi:hypothetical protein
MDAGMIQFPGEIHAQHFKISAHSRSAPELQPPPLWACVPTGMPEVGLIAKRPHTKSTAAGAAKNKQQQVNGKGFKAPCEHCHS